MSSKSQQFGFGYSTTSSTVDAATIDHESSKGRSKFYQAILESLYLKIDLAQFQQPIPENYKRLRNAAAFERK
uniref:Uncharacterized protein n=1 Tax=Panagrolaimus sp. PS1159 TaxID=55785 RepID=A0AC35FZA9_9BILA